MGLMIDGRWHDRGYDTDASGGRFQRWKSRFRSWITADGSPGPGGEGGFRAERGRYHLYVSWACPWAHRTLVFRKLKGLDEILPISVVHWYMGGHGWTFADGPGVIPDTVNGARHLHEIYRRADPGYSGRVTVPVLWDRERKTIVNNESSEIIRMLNSAFDEVGAKPGDYYPEALRGEIDAINARVYEHVNDGVYKAGFATTQQAYEEALWPLFETLGWLDGRLATRRWLCGARLTEADVRLWTTLLRFDPVYNVHFKCNLRRIADYPNLSGFLRDLYQWPGVSGTVRMDHIRKHYYRSHGQINPNGIVAAGPIQELNAQHGREAS